MYNEISLISDEFSLGCDFFETWLFGAIVSERCNVVKIRDRLNALQHNADTRQGEWAHAPTCLIHDDALLIHSCDHAEGTSEKNAVIRFWKRKRLSCSFLFSVHSLGYDSIRLRNGSKEERCKSLGPNENKEILAFELARDESLPKEFLDKG